MRIALGTLLLAWASTTAFGADVYRTTAPDGTVSFTDRPQGSGSQFVFSASRGSVAQSAPAAGAAVAGATPPAEAPAPPAPAAGPSAAQLRAERQKNCEVARENQERYQLSMRLYRTNAAGQREYLDDAAVAAVRAKAAQDVEDWCG